MSTLRGRFIVLEGTDGSGTTTQCRRLGDALRARGQDCLETREPSVGPIGKLLRAALEKRLEREHGNRGFDASTLALLFAADRLDHVASEIAPALEQGQWVVSDRYTLSSLIYQSLTAVDPEAALQWVTVLNREAMVPDLVLVLDVGAEVAASRRAARGGPEELFDGQSLQSRLAVAYEGAERYSHNPVRHIDGALDADAVFSRIWREVESLSVW